jgi:hypothetical protein
MVRALLAAGIVMSLLAAPVSAGQTSASFHVGITILPPGAKVASQRPAKAARPKVVRSYTWGAAAVSVSRAGFGAARRANREGSVYWFVAQRGSERFRVAVSVTSGAIVKVISA